VKHLDRPTLDNPLHWNSTYTMIAKVLPFYAAYDQYGNDFTASYVANATTTALSSTTSAATTNAANVAVSGRRGKANKNAPVSAAEVTIEQPAVSVASTPAIALLTSDDWQTLHDCKPLLETLVEFYYYISSQELPTIHNGIVTMHDLENYLNEQLSNNSLLIQSLTGNMLTKLQTLYQEVLPKEHIIGKSFVPISFPYSSISYSPMLLFCIRSNLRSSFEISLRTRIFNHCE
jgi:hypothetical protein